MRSAPAFGDAAPEFKYQTASGESHLLSESWASGPALILWLRHFG
ncbi:MAG TPA: hypothetical protein VJX29_01240 [Candidatus Acidoferrales bacterium]|nr:hypothetical protein [Candidatus Acidoferrales bacterium]